MRVAIIGGGLAGCAAAYVLKRAGLTPVIYEAAPELAAGASGNALGLYNPRLSAHYSSEAQYYDYGFQKAREVFRSLCHPERLSFVIPNECEGSSSYKIKRRSLVSGTPRDDNSEGQQDDNIIDYNPCGALHLVTDEKKEKRFRQMKENWPWSEGGMRWCSAAEASALAGVEIPHEALYLASSGFVSPRELCAAYTQGVEVCLNTRIETLEELDADAVILACAAGVNDFAPELPLQTIRGQVTYVRSSGVLAKLKTCLCYGGYTAPAHEGVHMVGSTFQRWLDHTDILPEDDRANIEGLAAAVPALAGDYEVTGQRVALRTASRDQFPVVGALPGRDNVYASAAHGSHGIISSLAAAYYLHDLVLARVPALSREAIDLLNPARFL